MVEGPCRVRRDSEARASVMLKRRVAGEGEEKTIPSSDPCIEMLDFTGKEICWGKAMLSLAIMRGTAAWIAQFSWSKELTVTVHWPA